MQTKVAVVRPVDVKYYTSIREHQDIFVVGGSAVYPSPEVEDPSIIPFTYPLWLFSGERRHQ